MFAAIGTDGARPVVWGFGSSAEQAVDDADAQEGSDASLVLEVSAAVARRVERGEVGVEELGIALTARQVRGLGAA